MGAGIAITDEKPTSDVPRANGSVSRPVGRPSLYNEKLANEICDLIAQGKSVKYICDNIDGMPSQDCFYRWLWSKPEFYEKYMRAREAQTEFYSQEMTDISDTPVKGEKVTVKSDGTVETVTFDMLEHRKLQIETRKWIAAKLKPKKYGDSMAIKSDVSINVTVVTGLPETKLPVLEADIISVGIAAASPEDMIAVGILPDKKPAD